MFCFFWRLIIGDLFAGSSKAHLDEHVFGVGVEVVAGVLFWVALPRAPGTYHHPIVVKALEEKKKM